MTNPDLTNLDKFYVGGRWVAPISGQKLPVLDPATEAKVGTVSLGNSDDVNSAVSAASDAFKSYRFTSKEDRLSLLKAVKTVTENRFEDLAQAMRIEMGAPISMARAAQADAGLGHLDGFIEALELLEEQLELSNSDIMIREPIGVCGLITPWNWPINQIALKVLPALATGCTCVLKPSEHTPISAMVYAEILNEAGFPPGVFNLVNGTGAGVGAALSRHPDVRMMSFTGSTNAGIAVTHDAAPTVKRVTLELGGKSPNIVFADCGLEERVAASVTKAMFNTGQSCNAATRLLVERKCYNQALRIAKRTAEAIKVGDPAIEGDHIGLLFDELQYNRVQDMIELGIKEGATLLAGGPGKPPDHNVGWFVKPTVFADVTNDMQIAQEEIFGPVLVIIPFLDEAEAIEIANDTPYGLAAYIQTKDMVRTRRVSRQLQAGAVHLNGAGMAYGSPFGGFKQSGNGREGGMMGLEDYLETKTLHGF